MRPYSVAEVASAVGGKVIAGSRETMLTGAAIDSREVKTGGIFFAVKGETTDGHLFLRCAIENGCSAMVVSDKTYTDDLRELIEEKKIGVILAEDTLGALHDLARYHMNRLPLKYKIGVTGSVGKTSTRDFICGVAAVRYKAAKSLKNLNTTTGLPLSILEFPEDTEVAVLEMGMDQLGQIRELAELVRPDIAVITNVDITHIETLGTQENILRAKMEITSYFHRKSTLIYNGDCRLLQDREQFGDYSLVAVGGEGSADFTVKDICDFGADGIDFKIEHGGTSYDVGLNMPGAHNAINSALAVAAGFLMGIDVADAIKGAESVVLTGKRLEVLEHKGIRIINDTYNASPPAMTAALEALVHTKGKRKVAILGDMIGLGDLEEEYHRKVGECARELKVDVIISVGERAKHYDSGASCDEGNSGDAVECVHFADKQALIPELKNLLREGDVVLVKASRAIALEEVTEKIAEL